jgi:hypothetical protein
LVGDVADAAGVPVELVGVDVEVGGHRVISGGLAK